MNWVNPFSEKKQPSSGQGQKLPQPTTAETYISPTQLRETWNYKTASHGMFGEALPEGAEGWTPYGKPYFGEGISGKVKEYWWQLTRDVQAPSKEAWTELQDKWKSLNEQEFTPSYLGGQSKLPTEVLSTAVETIKTGWQALEADDSIVSPVSKLIGVTLKGVGDLFNLPAQALERAQGAGEGAREAAKELGVDTLPDFFPEDNWFTRYLNDINPITNGYTALQIALSPRKDKWQVFSENVEEGWSAGRIYYSGVFDPSIREEFLRRSRNGENPELLAMELENPVAELTGQFLIDPLNVLGILTKAKTIDRVLDASEVAVRASGTLSDTRAVEIFDEVLQLGKTDDIKAASLLDEFTQIQQRVVPAVVDKKLTQGFRFSDLAAISNQKVRFRDAQNFIGQVQAIAFGQGRTSDEIADFIRAGVMSVSKIKEEAQAGITALLKSDSPRMMFSEQGISTFSMVRKMLESTDGALDYNKVLRLGKSKTPQAFMDDAVDLLTASAKTTFPTVDEMADAYKLQQEAIATGGDISKRTTQLAKQFSELPKSVLGANFLNTKAQKVYSPLNRVLGSFYFSLQGGVAVKNILQNSIQILIDQGVKAFLRPVSWAETLEDGSVITKTRLAFWSPKKVEADLEKMLGFKTSLTSGFDTQFQTGGKSFGFSKLMEAGEASAANYVVWGTMKDSMRKLFTEQKLGTANALRTAGMNDKQVNLLYRLMNDNYGDLEKTLVDFRKLNTTGSIEEWRTLDFIPKHYEDGLRELDIYDELADFAKRGGNSRKEVEDFFASLKKDLEARSEVATMDGARISEKTPGFETMNMLEEAVQRGEITDNAANEVLRNWLVASDNAKHQYMESLQDTIDWANRNLPQSQSVQFSERMKALRKSEQAGKATAEQNGLQIITSARQWSQEIRDVKNMTREQAVSYWHRIGISDIPPVDLNKQGLQDALWSYFRDLKGQAYQEYYGTIFKESQSIVEDLGKVTDITPLRAKLTQAESAVARANISRSAIYRKGTFYAPQGKRDVLSLAKAFEIETATEAGVPLDQKILNIIKKYGSTQAEKLDDVTPEEAIRAFEAYRNQNGLPKVNLPEEKIVPAYPDGTLPSVARSWNENTRPALYALDKIKNEILTKFGQRIEGKLDDVVEKALTTYVKGSTQRIAEGKAIALKAAEHWRDFILHNYGAKTYGDLTFAYIMPYHFWYSQSYKNWMKRIVSDPHIIAGYFKYKQNLEKLNAESPEYFRGQMQIDGIFGIDFKHPLIFNLEAALNPLNGLLGVDFNDKEKRVNWWTSTLDDIGKFGPGVFAPLQWATALGLTLQGEEDAASRWAGRAIPQTALIKSGLSWAEQQFDFQLPDSTLISGLKYGELDPMVNMFSGGIDPYERARVGRILGLMVEDGSITQEQAIDAAADQKGAIWDEAVSRAASGRFATNALSWGLGVGFKPRTQTDVEIDAMFSELNVLRTLNSDGRLSPEQYRQSMDLLRDKYKYMDAVLLSRRGGEQRDSAYAYNVLGRLPPGASRDVLLSVGLTDEDIQKFYDSKGWTDKSIPFQQTEKDKFMTAITDLSAMLAMPDYATKTEWNEAKTQYQAMSDNIELTLGEDIWDKVSAYYDMRDIDKEQADQFKETHPEITEALQMQQDGVINNPILYEYYGSIDKLQSYYDGKVRQQLYNKYGDLSPLWQTYYDLKLQGNNRAAKAFYKSHPELLAYSKEKDILMAEANQSFIRVAQQLPEQEDILLRDDFTAETPQQKQLLQALQRPRIPSWQEIKQVTGTDITPAMELILNAHLTQGIPLSSAAQNQLEYLSSRYGSQLGINTPDQLLRIIGVALMTPQSTSPVPQTQQEGWVNPFTP